MYRVILRMNQRQLAEATGKGFSTIGCYERGARPIPKAFAMAVEHLANKGKQ